MIGAMTERSATGTERQFVCPFVAFDEDRDHRASVPDHRHRCFAESPAAARALAHQAAYCLSTAFPGCPTFIDWARREAAPPKDEPIRTLREAPAAPRQAERSAERAGRPIAPQSAPTTSGRQRRTEWTAPPPWAPDAGTLQRAGDTGREPSAPAPSDASSVPDEADRDDVDDIEENGTGTGLGTWSGSALGSLAPSAGPSTHAPAGSAGPAAGVDPERDPGRVPFEPAAPAFLAGRRPSPGRDRDRNRAGLRPAERAVGPGPGRPAADPSAPSWERPRRFEAYPSLKSGGGRVAALPRPVLYGLIVLIAGLALFATPFVLKVITGSGDAATSSPTPGASASASTSAAPTITPVASPSPTVYTVKAGDVLSRIAVKFGVTVDQIVKANPQIKNPDRLALGDELVIPPTVSPAITDGAITPGP